MHALQATGSQKHGEEEATKSLDGTSCLLVWSWSGGVAALLSAFLGTLAFLSSAQLVRKKGPIGKAVLFFFCCSWRPQQGDGKILQSVHARS